MKVLQLNPAFYPAFAYGETVNVSYNLSRALAKRGHDVTVFTSDTICRFKIPEGISISKINEKKIIILCVSFYKIRNDIFQMTPISLMKILCLFRLMVKLKKKISPLISQIFNPLWTERLKISCGLRKPEKSTLLGILTVMLLRLRSIVSSSFLHV